MLCVLLWVVVTQGHTYINIHQWKRKQIFSSRRYTIIFQGHRFCHRFSMQTFWEVIILHSYTIRFVLWKASLLVARERVGRDKSEGSDNGLRPLMQFSKRQWAVGLNGGGREKETERWVGFERRRYWGWLPRFRSRRMDGEPLPGDEEFSWRHHKFQMPGSQPYRWQVGH